MTRGYILAALLLASNAWASWPYSAPSSGGGGGSGDVNGPASSVDGQVPLFSGTSGKLLTTGSLYTANSGTSLGINNSTPTDNTLALYHLGSGSTTWRNFESVLIVPTSGSASYHEGLYADVHFTHPSGTVDLGRNYQTCEMSGNGTVTECYGSRAITRLFDFNAPTDVSNGIITTGYGLEAYVGNVSTGGGKIRKAVGIYISRAQATGSDSGGGAHVATGLRIDNVVASGGDSNAAYAIDTSQAAAPLLFGGDLLFASGFNFDVGNYGQPVRTVWVGGLKFRGNAYSIMFETNNLSQDYTLRWPDALGVSGQAMVIDSGSNMKFGSVTDVAIATTGTQPTCASGIRGKLWINQGGTGVADVMQVCMKDAANAYGWKTFTVF